MDTATLKKFQTLGLDTIDDLRTENGFLASSKKELFGFVFGRDSAITSLILLDADKENNTTTFQADAARVLRGLGRLQGKEINIESGEAPGKILHDYRESGHELLTRDLPHPWYVYPDGVMRSFDSIDSTPLYLMLAARYLAQYKDAALIKELDAVIRAALGWLLDYADQNNDGLIDYRIHPDRQHGGLSVQNWMDHPPTLFHEDGKEVALPVAALEVQAYAYEALRSWAAYYEKSDTTFGNALTARADRIRNEFHRHFIVSDEHGTFLAANVDGNGAPLLSPRSSMGHVLFTGYHTETGTIDRVLDEQYILSVADRLMQADLFVPEAGVRTLSRDSKGFASDAYHNGAIWPHDTYLVAAGLRSVGRDADAQRLFVALMHAYQHFGTPLELLGYDQDFEEFHPEFRDPACKYQGWSAAAMVAVTAILLRAQS